MEIKNKKECFRTILIVILAFLLIAFSSVISTVITNKSTIVDESFDKQETAHNNSLIRITLNGLINVKDGIMQDINFANYNDERIIEFSIMHENTIIYESDYINPGEIVMGDFISTDTLVTGLNEAIVEVRYYSLSKTYIGQTNVKVDLDYMG